MWVWQTGQERVPSLTLPPVSGRSQYEGSALMPNAANISPESKYCPPHFRQTSRMASPLTVSAIWIVSRGHVRPFSRKRTWPTARLSMRSPRIVLTTLRRSRRRAVHPQDSRALGPRSMAKSPPPFKSLCGLAAPSRARGLELVDAAEPREEHRVDGDDGAGRDAAKEHGRHGPH